MINLKELQYHRRMRLMKAFHRMTTLIYCPKSPSGREQRHLYRESQKKVVDMVVTAR